MIGQTLAVTFVFALLALSRRQPGSAVGIVIMSMMLWPEYLRVPMGLAEMSAPRIVAALLLVQSVAKGEHRDIEFRNVDTLIFAIWVWTILATILAHAEFTQTTQMIGRGLDTVLMYFVARIRIRTAADVRGLFAGLAVAAIAMCLVGVTESVTSRSPYSSMFGYRLWQGLGFEKDDEYRLGLLRAKASTGTHIFFGMAMMVIFGMLWAARGYTRSRLSSGCAMIAAALAGLSSMSSGPWMGLLLVIVLNGFAGRVAMIRPAIYSIICLALVMEALSHRHFYHLIDYLALDAETAWYRTRLLEVGLSQWRDFWLVGVGSNWPHHWAAKVDGRDHIDVVNHFLMLALYGGFPAAIMYISTHVIGIRLASQAWRETMDSNRRKWLFGLGATVIALDFSSMSVGLFGPVLLLSHVLLGSLISAATAWRVDEEPENPREEELHLFGRDSGPFPDGSPNSHPIFCS